MENNNYVPNPQTPCTAIFIDPTLCRGCNTCVNVCRNDVLIPAVPIAERTLPSIEAEVREQSFVELESGLFGQDVKQEGARSLISGPPPVPVYSDECWFCGVCVEHCPVPGAIRMEHPLNQRIAWKRKETGEFFRIGMKTPPPPNKKPPVGGW